MMNLSETASPAILAFVTTLHLALAVLRWHRSPALGTVSIMSVVSLLFAGTPWLLTSSAGLAIGFVAHFAWFVACERLLPAAVSAPKGPPSPALSAPPRASGVTALARRPPASFVQTPVMAVYDEARDIRTFRIARPEGFEFKAGQFLTVRVRADGKEHVRCYSISSSPGARGYLEISVKRLGMVSGTLHATVRPGSMMSVRAPAGHFVYPAGEDRPMVLMAGGVGITPLMCMLRHALETEPMRPCTLFYSVRSVEDIAFRDEIALLERRFAQFRAFFTITEGPVPDGGFKGRINQALVTAMAPDVAHSVCLLCGPQPMIDAMTTMLTSIGVPRTQITSEVFQAAIAASTASPAAAAAPAESAAHTLRFKRSGVVTDAPASQTMLEAAESCGAAIPSLCRAGVCGTCRTRVLSGDARCASAVLDEQDRQDGFVLACATRVHSDCTVDA